VFLMSVLLLIGVELLLLPMLLAQPTKTNS